jgi:hypothetical protein
MKKEISSIIEKVGGKVQFSLVEENNENVISFSKTVDGNEFTFILIFAKEHDMLVINLLHAFQTQYENMGVDFYGVINKLNETCIQGYLGFIKGEKTQIAYKASYIGDVANLTGNKSFEYFFQVSFDMVDYFHSQLN